MDGLAIQVAVLVLVVVLAVASLKVGAAGAGSRVGAWLALTLVTLWCEAVAAFVILHAVLFMLGTTAVWAGLVLTGAVMLATPWLWGRAIRRSSHGPVAHG